ncbi:LptF/LptG family permease [Methylocapsa acidiphila]|uniref:LptF/LptG family permease n=1 Tax=Methylocapsa acidiphila TaxID=133552 RepID=UPI00041FB54E|nr:LptF/LptG family permease [Methylocapsa acidiphila]
MPRLLTLYLVQRIAVLALLIEAGLCIPVVLASLFHQLPAAAMRGGLFLPALYGTLPTVLYVALPMAVGIAVALEFSRMSSEGMVAVLYSLRLSVWSLCVPACLVASVAVVFGYWISTVVAPANVGKMHDVIYVIQNSLNHRMLEPGRFYHLDNGYRTLYFERWRSVDVATGMYIRQFSPEKNEEQIINAAVTEFRRNETGVVMILSNGSIQTRAENGATMQSANFDEYVIPINMQGASGLPKRDWRGAFELTFSEFFPGRPGPDLGPRRYAEWMSEGTKRFAIPILALAHSLLAIGLILNFCSATGRASAAGTVIIALIPIIHIAFMVGAESLVRQNTQLVWLIASAIVAEFMIALLLIERQNASFPLLRTRPRQLAGREG